MIAFTDKITGKIKIGKLNFENLNLNIRNKKLRISKVGLMLNVYNFKGNNIGFVIKRKVKWLQRLQEFLFMMSSLYLVQYLFRQFCRLEICIVVCASLRLEKI